MPSHYMYLILIMSQWLAPLTSVGLAIKGTHGYCGEGSQALCCSQTAEYASLKNTCKTQALTHPLQSGGVGRAKEVRPGGRTTGCSAATRVPGSLPQFVHLPPAREAPTAHPLQILHARGRAYA